MLDWYINDYVLGYNGSGHPAVSGYFFDDHWDNFTAPDDFSLGPTEVSGNAVYDMGLGMAEISAVRAAYSWSMDRMYRALLDKQKFAWQLLCEPCPHTPTPSPAPAALVL